jgi:hypothetical protein
MPNGNYAMKLTCNNANNCVGIDMDWLHYVFNVQGADAITYKFYALIELTNPKAQRSAFYNGGRFNDDGTRNKDDSNSVGSVYVADGQYWLQTITKEQYSYYFNADGTSKKGWDKVAFATLYRPDGSTNAVGAYIDDITVVFND